ncbi:50S ribosomal protein L18 [Candidatus Woesearchaeota archaeon CG10_big_fil_rev_8_21_14_0_10_45_5]|nr:MAG: 50S ribosomal protein L18 [Candidatus Woesearchaeota archaeon CG10_big_fil_rev_8_21_14_0_10_45_5]PIU29700.1 MAG: 50S ribosomal protein L18 [Candidatus Woesearchaeota archaeon CG07_land_8_20_14_0_80_44_23]
MKKNRIKTVVYRRKREGKTNYPKRIRLLSSRKPRLVVRKSLKNMHIQLISYTEKGDKVIASADSRELIKYGWNLNRGNLPAAYLTGLLIGKKAKGKAEEAILDIGLQESIGGSKLYAALKGAVDAGMKIPHSNDIFPDEKRIRGEDITAYALKLKKEEPDRFKRFFANYEKNAPTLKVEDVFEKVRENILGDKAKAGAIKRAAKN